MEQDKNDKEKLQEKIKEAVKSGDDIRQTVRSITLKALTEGKMNIAEIKQITKAVVKGAEQGISRYDSESKKRLENALSGLDDALSSAAEASKLALEEAAGHLKTLSQTDFKQAMDDLMALEEIYLDSVKHVAKGANDFIANTLNDLLKHAQKSGTKVGLQTTKMVKTLNKELAHNLSEKVVTSSQSTLKVASQLSYAAAGFLEGIAQTLEEKINNSDSSNKK